MLCFALLAACACSGKMIDLGYHPSRASTMAAPQTIISDKMTLIWKWPNLWCTNESVTYRLLQNNMEIARATRVVNGTPFWETPVSPVQLQTGNFEAIVILKGKNYSCPTFGFKW